MLSGPAGRGFTLVEIMLSLVMLLVVSGSLYRLLLDAQRLSRTQAERIALQSSVRGVSLVVGSELRELSTTESGIGAENDILSLASHAISYRAMRGFGYTCQAQSGGVLLIRRSVFVGYRDPQARRDSALIYSPGLVTPADSGWTPVALTQVSSAGSCSGVSGPTLELTAAGAVPLGLIPSGTPVRIYEPMELALYRSDGQAWLGLRSLTTGEAIQPLFGPLASEDGFQLEFSDASGSATNVPARVKSITVSIHGVARVLPPSGGAPDERLTTRIMLRNAH
jgi:prepilin-type N-terminal cleavage/methylation domain-containing protein